MPAKQTSRPSRSRHASLAVLRRHAIFGKLASKDLKRLSALATERPAPAGTTIARRGDLATAMFVLRAGTVKMTKPPVEGRDASIDLLQAGDVFGEYALLSGQPRATDAEAETDCELAVVKRADFQKFVQGDSKLALKLVELLSAELIQANRRVEEAVFLSVPTRLARTVLRLMEEAAPEDGKLRIKQRELAQMIQASRETVNKHLREWTRRRWIKPERVGITVVDNPALTALARSDDGHANRRQARRGAR
jgi:CRP/FNR family cyclic AMP-dependent transcriptional regulator